MNNTIETVKVSIPPQNTPLLPQMTTHFTLESLKALSSVSVMPSLTAKLCNKRIHRIQSNEVYGKVFKDSPAAAALIEKIRRF